MWRVQGPVAQSAEPDSDMASLPGKVSENHRRLQPDGASDIMNPAKILRPRRSLEVTVQTATGLGQDSDVPTLSHRFLSALAWVWSLGLSS